MYAVSRSHFVAVWLVAEQRTVAGTRGAGGGGEGAGAVTVPCMRRCENCATPKNNSVDAVLYCTVIY